MRANSVAAFLIFLPVIVSAQTPEFQIAKITKNLIPTPQLAYAGGPQHQNQTNQRDRWLEVEVEFKAAPEITNELTLKYYILFNGTLLTGEVPATTALYLDARELKSACNVQNNQ